MAAYSSSLATDFDQAAANIDPARVSVPKWHPVRDVLAEALAVDPTDVYVTTVSKAGNLGVRFDQSRGAREADVAAAMYPDNDPAELNKIVRSAETRFPNEQRRYVLVFAEQSSHWSLRAILKAKIDSVPSALVAAWPAATVVNV